MAVKIVIGILLLTAVTFTVIYVVLPKIGTNSSQSDTFQPDEHFSTLRQETIGAKSENSGNPIADNTSSNSNPAIDNPHSSSNTSNPIGNITSATTDELRGKLLTEKQPPVLERLIQELKNRNDQNAINILIEQIKQTTGPERARYIMILGRFEDIIDALKEFRGKLIDHLIDNFHKNYTFYDPGLKTEPIIPITENVNIVILNGKIQDSSMSDPSNEYEHFSGIPVIFQAVPGIGMDEYYFIQFVKQTKTYSYKKPSADPKWELDAAPNTVVPTYINSHNCSGKTPETFPGVNGLVMVDNPGIGHTSINDEIIGTTTVLIEFQTWVICKKPNGIIDVSGYISWKFTVIGTVDQNKELSTKLGNVNNPVFIWIPKTDDPNSYTKVYFGLLQKKYPDWCPK